MLLFSAVCFILIVIGLIFAWILNFYFLRLPNCRASGRAAGASPQSLAPQSTTNEKWNTRKYSFDFFLDDFTSVGNTKAARWIAAKNLQKTMIDWLWLVVVVVVRIGGTKMLVWFRYKKIFSFFHQNLNEIKLIVGGWVGKKVMKFSFFSVCLTEKWTNW